MCDNKPSEKLKYNDKGFERELEINKVIYVPGLLPTNNNHQSANIEVETNLLQSENTYKKKNLYKLDTDDKNKNKDYRNFTLNGEKNRETLN